MLLVSGYADESIVARARKTEGVEFIPKPLTASLLLARVRDLLERRTAQPRAAVETQARAPHE